MGVTTGDVARKNERFKLLATWMNNFSIAFAVAGFVAPLIGAANVPDTGRVSIVFFWIALAAGIHCVGQYVLGGVE